MAESLIIANNISKKFCKDLKKGLWYGLQDLGDGILGRDYERKLRPEEFWAVNDLSFEVKRGECLGLIGHNGAGKSTLLKMLNGLIKPDKGQIEMHGRVGALIELGAGFNPILSGRENIFNNAAVLGFTKKETQKKLEEIIDFAEVRDFIDTPVQYYSSGMKVRLGFAVAAQMEPDILLIDEVLAVGDMGFILKCFNRMDQLLNNTAMILVSHSMPQIARMSTKILLMDHGKEAHYSNDVNSGMLKYYQMFQEQIGNFNSDGSADLEFINLKCGNLNSANDDKIVVNYGDTIELEVIIKCNRNIDNPAISLGFYDKEQRNFAEVDNFLSDYKIEKADSRIKFKTRIENINFAQGNYSISLAFHETVRGKQVLFRYQAVCIFTVHSKLHGWAPVQLSPEWSYEVE